MREGCQLLELVIACRMLLLLLLPPLLPLWNPATMFIVTSSCNSLCTMMSSAGPSSPGAEELRGSECRLKRMLDPSSAQVADVILLVRRTLAAPGNGTLANERVQWRPQHDVMEVDAVLVA